MNVSSEVVGAMASFVVPEGDRSGIGRPFDAEQVQLLSPPTDLSAVVEGARKRRRVSEGADDDREPSRGWSGVHAREISNSNVETNPSRSSARVVVKTEPAWWRCGLCRLTRLMAP